MPVRQVSGNTGIVPPYIRDRAEASRIQSALVDANKKGKVGTRTIELRIGSKAVQTDEAMRALLDGKKVKATVVEFKTARGSKMTGGSYYKAKIRVPGINIQTFSDVNAMAKFVDKNVLQHNAKLQRVGND